MGCLYQIEFSNGKSYIGITSKDSSYRLKQHLRDSRKTDRRAGVLYDALLKYPDQYTIKEIAWSDDFEVLCRIEQTAIGTFNTKVPFGYNMTDGGEGTVGFDGPWKGKSRPKFSEEWIKKATDHLKGNKFALGLVHTEESKKKMGQRGNQHSKGKTWKLSEETKQKMREAWIRRKNT
jgi:group I intron endonuclease